MFVRNQTASNKTSPVFSVTSTEAVIYPVKVKNQFTICIDISPDEVYHHMYKNVRVSS